MFRRFLFSRIWSSAQDHAVLALLLSLVGFFISTWQNLSGGNEMYWRCTSFEKAFRRGRPFNILLLIHWGGRHRRNDRFFIFSDINEMFDSPRADDRCLIFSDICEIFGSRRGDVTCDMSHVTCHVTWSFTTMCSSVLSPTHLETCFTRTPSRLEWHSIQDSCETMKDSCGYVSHLESWLQMCQNSKCDTYVAMRHIFGCIDISKCVKTPNVTHTWLCVTFGVLTPT